MKEPKRCAQCGERQHHSVHTAEHSFVKPDEWAARKKAQEPRPCELASESPCGRGQMGELTWHHVQPRQAGGTSQDTSPLMRLCVKHHRFIESNRAEAKRRGWLA